MTASFRFGPALGRAAVTFLLCLAAPLLPGPAAADPAWQTWAYPGYFSDLLSTSAELWGATREGGLVRFDRATGAIEMFHHEPGGLASNELTALALDGSGRLWVGTVGNGVSRRRADGSGWDLVNSFDGLPVDSVTALHAVGDTVWIGTTRGLALWNGNVITGSLPDGNTVSFDTTFSSIAITAILQTGDSLWLGTRRGIGLARVSTGLSDWRTVNEGVEVVRRDIEDMVTNGADVFVVGLGYCYRFRPGTNDWQFIDGTATSMFGGPGVMLLGTTSGIARWNGFNVTPLPGAPLPVPKPTDGYVDQVRPLQAADGTVFGASANFVYRETAPGTWAAHEIPCPPDNNLVDLELDRSRVYVTTFGGGIGRWDGTLWRQWKAGTACAGAGCDTTFENPVFTLGMLADSEGRKWVGSWTYAFERFEDDGAVPSFTRIWDVTPNGDVNQPNAGHTWVYSATEDANGGRWFGLDTASRDDINPLGLAYYDPDEQYVRVFNNSDGMSGLFVRGLDVDKNGRLWIGYEGEGVDYVILAASPPWPGAFGVVHIAETSNYVVRGIHAHGDSIWVVTTSNLYRYTSRAVANSTAQDTIAYPGGQDQFAIQPLATSGNGTLWLGTGAGLREYRPDGTVIVHTTANSPLASNVIRALVVDPATDDLWIATNAGLHRFDPQYVAPLPPPIDRLTVKVWPNPAKVTGAGATLYLSGDGTSYTGRIYDILGRELRRVSTSANGQVFWDGRDADGRAVPPGVYLARVAAGGREAFTRFVLVR